MTSCVSPVHTEGYSIPSDFGSDGTDESDFNSVDDPVIPPPERLLISSSKPTSLYPLLFKTLVCATNKKVNGLPYHGHFIEGEGLEFPKFPLETVRHLLTKPEDYIKNFSKFPPHVRSNIPKRWDFGIHEVLSTPDTILFLDIDGPNTGLQSKEMDSVFFNRFLLPFIQNREGEFGEKWIICTASGPPEENPDGYKISYHLFCINRFGSYPDAIRTCAKSIFTDAVMGKAMRMIETVARGPLTPELKVDTQIYGVLLHRTLRCLGSKKWKGGAAKQIVYQSPGIPEDHPELTLCGCYLSKPLFPGSSRIEIRDSVSPSEMLKHSRTVRSGASASTLHSDDDSTQDDPTDDVESARKKILLDMFRAGFPAEYGEGNEWRLRVQGAMLQIPFVRFNEDDFVSLVQPLCPRDPPSYASGIWKAGQRNLRAGPTIGLDGKMVPSLKPAAFKVATWKSFTSWISSSWENRKLPNGKFVGGGLEVETAPFTVRWNKLKSVDSSVKENKLSYKSELYSELREMFERNEDGSVRCCWIQGKGPCRIKSDQSVEFWLSKSTKSLISIAGLPTSMKVPREFYDLWLEDPERLQLKGFSLLPPGAEEDGVVSTWKGFAAEKWLPSSEMTQSELRTATDSFWKIVESNCGVDIHGVSCFSYVEKWLAHMIKKPSEKPDTALVFHGSGGSGKSAIVKVMSTLVGEYMCHQSTNPSVDLFGPHPEKWQNSLLVGLSDPKTSETWKNAEQLKEFITQERVVVNPKGRDQYSVRNFSRFIFTTNSTRALKVDKTERRLNFFSSDNRFENDHKFWESFWNEYDINKKETFKPEIYGMLLAYLLRVDITGFNPRTRPVTKMWLEIREASLPLISRWLRDCFSGEWDFEHLEKYSTVYGFELKESFSAWCSEHASMMGGEKAFTQHFDKLRIDGVVRGDRCKPIRSGPARDYPYSIDVDRVKAWVDRDLVY